MAIDLSEIERIIHVADGLPPTLDSLYDREADVLYITFEPGNPTDQTLRMMTSSCAIATADSSASPCSTRASAASTLMARLDGPSSLNIVTH